jgi:hypothetical protein
VCQGRAAPKGSLDKRRRFLRIDGRSDGDSTPFGHRVLNRPNTTNLHTFPASNSCDSCRGIVRTDLPSLEHSIVRKPLRASRLPSLRSALSRP